MIHWRKSRIALSMAMFVLSFFYILFSTSYAEATTNLLTNGDFEVGDSTGWTVIENGGSGCTFGSLLSTSYDWCSVSQTISLVDAGYTAEQLDAEPGIAFDVSIYQRFDHAGYYYLEYKLLGEDGSSVIASQTYGSAGSPIYLDPSTDWFETPYTFSGYGTGARYVYIKLAGQDAPPDWGGNYGPWFDNATVSITDSTNPIASSYVPTQNATGVATSSSLEITFDENVVVSTGNIILKKSSNNQIFETIDVTGDRVTGSGTDTIIINPIENFDEITQYYVQIDATAIDDTSGNSYAGILDTTTWRFVTADESNPVVVSYSPMQTASNIATTANLILEFNEDVFVGTGNVTIKKSSDDSIFETIDITSDKVTGSGISMITINPEQNFLEETQYYVQIDATAIDDGVGNSYIGISDNSWSFTTADETDPEVLSFDPRDNAVNVATNTDVVINFSEEVNTNSGNITVYEADTDEVVEVVDVASDQVSGSGTSRITITLVEALSSQVDYYIKINSTAFLDDSGNAFAGISNKTTWNFRTQDEIAPTIISTSPNDNAMDIAVDTNLSITFSEIVVVKSGNIKIYNADGTLVESINVKSNKISGSGTITVAVNLSSDLDYGISYYIHIDATAFDDISGNSFAGISSSKTAWSFITVEETVDQDKDERIDESDEEELSDDTEENVEDEEVGEIGEVVPVDEEVSAEMCYYTTVSGNTLWDLAAYYYGNGNRYGELVTLNKSTYPNIETQLRIGMKLIVPCEKGTPPAPKTVVATQHVSEEDQSTQESEDEVESQVDVEQETEENRGVISKIDNDKVLDAYDPTLPIVYSAYDLRVKIEENGVSLVGVLVELHSEPRTAVTDEDGIAIFQDVEPGEHTVKLVYENGSVDEKIYVAGEDREFNIALNVEVKNYIAPIWVWIAVVVVCIFGGVIILRKWMKKDK